MRKYKAHAHGVDKLTVKICEAEVFSGLLLLLWRYYAQKAIVFALSPLRLAQGSAEYSPLPEGGFERSSAHLRNFPLPR